MEKIIYLIIVMVLSILSLICGFFCIKDPKQMIRFQQYFYSKINWRIEPICINKEIRNTRLMGVVMWTMVLIAFYFLRKLFN